MHQYLIYVVGHYNPRFDIEIVFYNKVWLFRGLY